MMLDGRFLEQAAQYRDALAKHRHPAGHRHAGGRNLLGAAAQGDIERQPAAREMVERGHLAREYRSVTQREDEHRGAELDAPRARRGAGSSIRGSSMFAAWTMRSSVQTASRPSAST